MNIETVVAGDLQTNCYIAYDPKTKEAVVIDPGAGSERILELLGELRLTPLYILITHGHPDHFGEAEQVSEGCGARILVHEDDAHILQSKILSLRGIFFPKTRVDRTLKDGEVIKFGSEELKVMHTPGHSRGGMCLYSEKTGVLFTGDTLFYRGWGRTDLPGSSEEQMMASLKTLFALPDNTKVYPGHGNSTTIGEVKLALAGEVK